MASGTAEEQELFLDCLELSGNDFLIVCYQKIEIHFI